MIDELAFQQTIRDGGGYGALAIWADWLEEQGDPRAEAARRRLRRRTKSVGYSFSGSGSGSGSGTLN